MNRTSHRAPRPLAVSVAVLLAAAAFLPAAPARAQNFSYIGNANGGFWGAATNWAPNGVPDGAATVVSITDGDATADITLTSGSAITPTVGTLNLTNSGGSGGGVSFSNGSLILASGGTINAGGDTGGVHAPGPNVFFRLDGPVTLNTSAGITFSNIANNSLGFQGTGPLVKTGAGTYIANSSNSTYTGGTIIRAGTVIFDGQGASGPFGTGPLRIESGTLDYRGPTALANALTIAGSFGVTIGGSNAADAGTLTFSSPVTLEAGTHTVTVTSTATNPATLAFSDTVSGAGGLAVAGNGTLRLAAANTFTGGTTLRSGTMQVEDDAALSSGALRVEGGTLAFTGDRTLANAVTLAGPLTVAGAGAPGPDPVQSLTLAGSVALEGSGLRRVTLAPGGAPLELDLAGVISGEGGLDLRGGGALGGVVNFSGSAPNTFTGQLRVDGNLRVVLDKTGGSAVPGNLFVVAGRVEFADPSRQVGGSVASAAGGTLVPLVSQEWGAVELAGPVQALGGAPVTLSIGSGVTAGAITDAARGGALTLRKTGAGTLTLNGTNAYRGGTRLEEGTLVINSDAALGAADAPLVAGVIEGPGVTLRTRTNPITSTRPVTLNSTLTADAASSSLALRGVVDGAGGLIKAGAQTLTLGNAANTFAGGVAVQGGTLEFAGDGALGAPGGGLRLEAATTTRLTADWATVRTVTLADVTLDDRQEPVSRGAIEFSTNGFNATLGGTVSGEFSDAGAPTLRKTGAGTLRFQGEARKGVFDVQVAGGRVLVAAGAIVASDVTVENGGELGGDGQIGDLIFGEFPAGGSVTNSGLVSPGDPQGDQPLPGDFAAVRLLAAAVPGGDPTGTLRLRGDYAQTVVGTLQIEIAGRSAGDFDVLSVGGAAALDGTVRVLSLNGFRPRAGDRFVFLTADGGVTGRFAAVQSDAALIAGRVQYDANSATLVFRRRPIVPIFDRPNDPAPVPDAPHLPRLTPNQRSVARQLDRALDERSLDRLFAELDREALPGVPAALDRIAPEEYAVIPEIGINSAAVQAFNLDRHASELRAGLRGFSSQNFRLPGIAEGPDGKTALRPDGTVENGSAKDVMAATADNRWSVFLSGSGEWVNVGSDSNARVQRFTTGGFTVGADYRIDDGIAIGAFAGYAGTGAELRGDGHVLVNSGKLGLYAAAWGQRWSGHAIVAGGWNDYDLKRQSLGGTARGETSGGEASAALSASYDAWQTEKFYAGPVVEGQWARVGYDGFTERGSAAALRIADNASASLRSRLGVRLGAAFRRGTVTLRPEVRAFWQHEFGDRSRATDADLPGGAGNTFRVEGPQIGRDALIVNASLSLLRGEGFSTYVAYDGQLAQERLDAHTVSAGVRLSY